MIIKKTVAALAVVSLFACAEKAPETKSKDDENVESRHMMTNSAINANTASSSSQSANTTATGSNTILVDPPMPMPMPMPPAAGTPPVTGAPPVAGTPPITGTPPFAGTPPVAGTPPFTGTPPITGTPPVTGAPPVAVPAPSPAPVIQTAFQHLPLLVDTDGNPNDLNATYNLSVDANVPVTVTTPTGSWTTPMMRYNNSQLPPVIKAKRGTNITVNVQSNLAEDTTIHWHGFKIPAIQDGGPDSPILPGGTRTYNFQLAQAAAPLWFHPHAHGTTATQVYNGLAGAFVVTDDITDNLEATNQLPSGNYDIPLLIQDRSFAADDGTGTRALVYGGSPMTAMMGMLGDTFLVNGVQQPTLNVETRQYRFRLFNGSNARTYEFALSNGATFNVIGTDGGLLPSPVVTDSVVLSAGERAEIVIDFRGSAINDNIAIVNRATSNLELIRFNVATAAVDNINLYTSLPTNAEIFQRLTAADATNARSFVMSMGPMMGPGGMTFTINGKLFDINRVDELVAAGSTEIWSISNTSGMAHPFHAHAIQWQVLDRNTIPANGIELGWKDTVLVQPGETVRIIGRFDPVINRGLYMYHCHILEHEDAGMMGTFQIQ